METVLEEQNETRPTESAATSDRLAVIVPVYNEERTVAELLRRLEVQRCVSQIIIVDDGSTDRTYEELEPWRARASLQLRDARDSDLDESVAGPLSEPSIIFLHHETKCGKGRAIRTGLDHVTSSHVIIQDADLEYSPNDIAKLWRKLKSGQADAVYGSRYLKSPDLQRGRFVLQSGVRFLNLLVRILYGLKLTDEANCYKMFRTSDLQRMHLQCERFEFCPEVTGKAAIMRLRIEEVFVSYSPRTVQEGKKIRFRDAFEAAATLARIRLGVWDTPRDAATHRSSKFAHIPAMVSSFVLIVAAALKIQFAWQSGSILTGHALLALIETVIAFALVSGFWSRATNIVTILTFIAFSFYSFCLAMSGAEECRCFGGIRTSPWFALGIDVFILSMWLGGSGVRCGRPGATLQTIWSMLLVTLAIGASMLRDPAVRVAAEIVTGRELTVIQPGAWIGKQCPILDFASNGSQLQVGEWIVVLHRSGCSACRELHDEYAELGLELAANNNQGTSVAFLEVGYPDARLSNPDRRSNNEYSIGWLDPNIDWAAPTPSIVRISDGIVIDVEEHPPIGSSLRFKTQN